VLRVLTRLLTVFIGKATTAVFQAEFS